MCEVFSKLAIKTPEGCHWRRSGVFNVNYEQISQCSGVSIVDFEIVNAGWEACQANEIMQNYRIHESFSNTSPYKTYSIWRDTAGKHMFKVID